MRGALVSALLLTLAFPPFQVPLLPFVVLVPFAVAIGRLSGTRPREAALAGGLLGALHFALVLHWIPVALARHDPAMVPLYGVVVGVLALLLAGAGWALHHLRHRLGLPLALALPLVWTGAEWLRSEAAGPLAFPWLGLGTALAAVPSWAGVAEWVGERGVTLWLAAVNGLLADAWLCRRAHGGQGDGRRRSSWMALGPAALALVLAAAPVAWGIHRAATLPLRAVGEAILVQPGVPVGPDLDRRIALTREALLGLTPRLEPGATLVVLPEMVVPVPPAEARARPLLAAVVGMAARAEAPVLFGAPGVIVDEAGDTTVRNSAMVATGRGIFPLRFDKRALVPGVEATGLLSLGWPGAPPAGYEPGTAYRVLRVGTTYWGPLVCFESAFPEVSRRLRRNGADVLVNITNDGWLAGTGGFAQHPAHLVMRAIETRAGAVRVATTGRTLVIAPTGAVRDVAPFPDPAVVRAEVFTTDVETMFVRWGDLAGPATAIGTLLLLLLGEVRERRRRWARDGVPERYERWWWGGGRGRHGTRNGG